MIKSFEQFINENYSEMPVLTYGEEYGSPLFNEISESLMFEINNSINEGKIVIDNNIIEEGLFDTIGKLFKKGANKAADKVEDKQTSIDDIRDQIGNTLDNLGNIGGDMKALSKKINRAEIEKTVLEKIEGLCKSAEDICTNLAEKEENMYKTISEKMTAANEAVKTFMEQAIAKINEIVIASKNKIADVIAAVTMFCEKMAEFAKEALKKIGNGIVLAFSLPILLAYSLYKGAVKVCTTLVEKVKDGAKVLKEAFDKVKDVISNWVVDMLKQAKDILKNACDNIKDGAKNVAKAIGKTYLSIVAVLGQLATDMKDKISEAYNKFVDCVKEFTDDVKAYVSEKWDVVSKWCKKTATAFADGVKNVWEKTKEKVKGVVDSVKGAYKTLKDNAKSTWEEIEEWNDERQQEDIKAKMKYAADKWGKDTVESWVKEL